jgi:hypothetical protein
MARRHDTRSLGVLAGWACLGLTLGLAGCVAETGDVGTAAHALGEDLEVTLSRPPSANACDDEQCLGDGCQYVCDDDCCICWCDEGPVGNDTILWDLVEAGSGRGWTVLAPTLPDDEELWDVSDVVVDGVQTGVIATPEGETRCFFDRGTLSDAAGPIFEVRDGAVFEPGARTPAYSFEADGVHEDGGAIVLTSADQRDASPLRKAVIAALIAGVCR